MQNGQSYNALFKQHHNSIYKQILYNSIYKEILYTIAAHVCIEVAVAATCCSYRDNEI